MRVIILGMSALLAVGVFGAMLLSVWSTCRSADRAPDLRQGINGARVGCDSLLNGCRGGHSGGDCDHCDTQVHPTGGVRHRCAADTAARLRSRGRSVARDLL